MTRRVSLTPAFPRWQRRPDERPHALMTSALKLLMKHGYRRVRLDAVAEAAGVSKGTVYHYFTSKDDLLTRSISQRMAEKRADIERQLEKSGGPASDRLRMFLQSVWDASLTPQAGLWQQMLSEIASEAPDVFAAWSRGLVQRWRAVARLIREGRRQGEFRRDVNPEISARMIIASLSHQALYHVHLKMNRFAPYPHDRLCSAVVDEFIHGLRAPARRSARPLRRGVA